MSLSPLADKGLGPVWGSYRYTLWSFRRLSLYPLADLGQLFAISALIALPFGHFGAYRSTFWLIWANCLPFQPLSLYPLAISALIALPSGRFGPMCCHFGPYRSTPLAISALIALLCGQYWDNLVPFRPLSLYALAISALSYVSFVSVPCRANSCRTLSKLSSVATHPLDPGGVSSWLTPRGLGFAGFFGQEVRVFSHE